MGDPVIRYCSIYGTRTLKLKAKEVKIVDRKNEYSDMKKCVVPVLARMG